MEQVLGDIVRHDPNLHVTAYIDVEAASQAAADFDRRFSPGSILPPLAGLPIGVTDLQAVDGMPTHHGLSPRVDPSPSERDSPTVASLRHLGAIPIAKMAVTELGIGSITRTTAGDPMAVQRIHGAPIPGSVRAVVEGLLPLTTELDLNGTLRIPAALCGLTSITTTPGWTTGTWLDWSGLTTGGICTASLAESTWVLDLLSASTMKRDPTHVATRPIHLAQFAQAPRLPSRIAYTTAAGGTACSPSEQKSLLHLVNLLSDHGVEIVEYPNVLDADLHAMFEAIVDPIVLEAIESLGYNEMLNLEIQARLERAQIQTALESARARHHAYLLSCEIKDVLDSVDALLTPLTLGSTQTSPCVESSSKHAEPRWNDFAIAFNLSGQPVATLPASTNLLGAQIVGRRFDDANLVRYVAGIAELVERGTL
ncbi:MAG: amidase family protein [Ferrimicrobium sp.]